MVERNLVLRGLEDLDRDRHVVVHHLAVSLLPWPWPYRGAYSFTFDCEATYGGGSSFRGETEVVPQLAALFAQNGVKATFNFLGRVAEEHGEAVAAVQEAAQDIAGHGYAHRNLDGLPAAEQEAEIGRAIDAIGAACGQRIVGWRSPWGTYDRCTYEALERLGFKWASNWSRSMWGTSPFYPVFDRTNFRVVEIPFDDVHFDAQMYNKYHATPRQVFALWRNYMLEARRSNGLFVLLCHPVNLAEDMERVEVIERLLSFGLSMGDLWLCSCGELAARWEALRSVTVIVDSISEGRDTFRLRITVQNRSSRPLDDLTLLVLCRSPVGGIVCDPHQRAGSLCEHNRAYVRIPRVDETESVSLDIRGDLEKPPAS